MNRRDADSSIDHHTAAYPSICSAHQERVEGCPLCYPEQPAAQDRRWWQFWRDPEPPPRRPRIGIVNAPGAKASVRGTTFGAGLDIGIVNDGEIDSEGSTHE